MGIFPINTMLFVFPDKAIQQEKRKKQMLSDK